MSQSQFSTSRNSSVQISGPSKDPSVASQSQSNKGSSVPNQNVKIIQKNIMYVIGLSPRISTYEVRTEFPHFIDFVELSLLWLVWKNKEHFDE